MMAFNYDRAHGRGHTHHLQVAACRLTDVRASMDASRHSFCWFLLAGSDNTATDLLKQLTLVLL